MDLVVLTPGAARNIKDFPGDFIISSSSDIFREHWLKGKTFIVFGALGAVVRTIAPLLENKNNDPAVIVVDSAMKNFIPLLGGHRGGAEELSLQLAAEFGGNPILTGFSRNQGFLVLDNFGDSWGWKRSGESAKWSLLMKKQSQNLPISISQTCGSSLWKSSQAALKILPSLQEDFSNSLTDLLITSKNTNNCSWHPPVLWVGIGCERNTSQSLIKRAFKESFDQSGLSQNAIAGIATIDIKFDEKELIAFCDFHRFSIRFYSAKELSKVVVPNPSELVNTEVGTCSVAEASSLLAAGNGSSLKYQKHIFKAQNTEKGAVVLAIAESLQSFAPQRGELHLIGSGPGDLGLLSDDARKALARSTIWFGYKRYLDLLEPLRRDDQVRVDGSLTNERARCEQALNLATTGARVALISSGDSGIYGMSGLALELWLERAKKERPSFEVHPGITAFIAAAAKIGAPLMHDFCAISLSDCLTPWEKIQQRLTAAAQGDFVIAIYNPKSVERNWQLKSALTILKEYRASSTPVVIARQVGRKEENISIHSIDNFPFEEVDMLTIVLIGNNSSFLKDARVITPRGY